MVRRAVGEQFGLASFLAWSKCVARRRLGARRRGLGIQRRTSRRKPTRSQRRSTSWCERRRTSRRKPTRSKRRSTSWCESMGCSLVKSTASPKGKSRSGLFRVHSRTLGEMIGTGRRRNSSNAATTKRRRGDVHAADLRQLVLAWIRLRPGKAKNTDEAWSLTKTHKKYT